MSIIIISLLLLVFLVPHLTFTAHVSIVNGNEAKPHSRPYMVSLQNHNLHNVCGGFLISEEFVLTAGHCRGNDEKLTVVVGAHNLKNKKEGSVRIRVKSYHRDKYNEKTLKNDIMLLKLEEKVKLSKNVNLISIPKKIDKKVINAGTACSVAGWGGKKTNGTTSDRLMEAKVEIMENKKCQKLWDKQDLNSEVQYLVSKMMCTHGHGGSCQGDSGGPLVCGNTAVGVASFGNPHFCNSHLLPNVYTKISEYLNWINKIIRKVK